MNAAWIKTLLDIMAAPKAFMAAFIISVILIFSFPQDAYADKKTIEFAMIFLAIFLSNYLALSGVMWVGSSIVGLLKRKWRHDQLTMEKEASLDALTPEEIKMLKELVSLGRKVGTVVLPQSSDHVINQLGRMSLISMEYIDSVGNYRENYRYRYEIDPYVFYAVQVRMASASPE